MLFGNSSAALIQLAMEMSANLRTASSSIVGQVRFQWPGPWEGEKADSK